MPFLKCISIDTDKKRNEVLAKKGRFRPAWQSDRPKWCCPNMLLSPKAMGKGKHDYHASPLVVIQEVCILKSFWRLGKESLG